MGMKCIIGLLIITLLSSCQSIRMQQEEQFLSASCNSDKIMIISHLPDHPEAPRLSLLVIPPTDSIASATVIFTATTNKERVSEVYYNDSVLPVHQGVFPVVYQHHPTSESGFDFFLYRHKLLFSGYGFKQQHIALEFSRQQPFTTHTTTSGIDGIVPVKTKKNEPGKLFIHTLNNTDQLFKKGTGISYYWIDYTLHSEAFTLYFTQTTKGEKNLIYTTTDYSFSEDPANDSVVFQLKSPDGNTLEFRALVPEKFQPGKGGFASTSATVIENDQQVGSAVIYLLAQP